MCIYLMKLTDRWSLIKAIFVAVNNQFRATKVKVNTKSLSVFQCKT